MHAVALAGLAAAALDVEAEAPGVVAARARLGHRREQLAQRREQSGVGRGIGARRAADRALVDVDDAIDVLEPLDALARARHRRGVRCSCAAAWPNSVSTISVDLPEPDTPVTQVNSPSGMCAVDVAQVVAARADGCVIWRARSGRMRRPGSAMRRRPERYWPVSEAGFGLDLAPGCPARPGGRRARRRRDPGPPRGRPRGSPPRRARPRSPCCRGRAAA